MAIPFTGVWRLVYIDGKGIETSRTVEAQSIEPYEEDCDLLAYCRLRQGERTFVATRIASMIDDATGEALTELGGIKLRSIAERRQKWAEYYLGSDERCRGLAEALAVASKGATTTQAAQAVIDLMPPAEAEDGITASALASAIGQIYRDMAPEGRGEHLMSLTDGLRALAGESGEIRQRVAEILVQAFNESSWTHDEAMDLIVAGAEVLSLEVKPKA